MALVALQLALGRTRIASRGMILGSIALSIAMLVASLSLPKAATLLFVLWLIVAIGALAGAALLSLELAPKIGPVFADKSILRFFAFFWLGILLADARPWIEARTAALPKWAASAIGWLGVLGYLVIPNAPDDNLALAMALRGATAGRRSPAWRANSR